MVLKKRVGRLAIRTSIPQRNDKILYHGRVVNVHMYQRDQSNTIRVPLNSDLPRGGSSHSIMHLPHHLRTL